MNKIFLIGDSHIHPIFNSIRHFFDYPDGREDPERNYPEPYRLSVSGKDCIYVFLIYPGIKAWDIDYSKLALLEEISKEDLVFVNIGECDIRQYLWKYKNTEKVVEEYFNKTVSFFSNQNLVFINPIPQVDGDFYQTIKGKNLSIPYKDRQDEHDIFISRLEYLCRKNNIRHLDLSLGKKYWSSDLRESDNLHITIDQAHKIISYILNFKY